MGFYANEADALNKAGPYFSPTNLPTDDPEHELIHFKIDSSDLPDDASAILAGALRAAMEFDQGITAWLDVTAEKFPAFVAPAIHATLLGLKVVVTWKGASSHAPDSPVPGEVLDAIRSVPQIGPLWDPIAARPVQILH